MNLADEIRSWAKDGAYPPSRGTLEAFANQAQKYAGAKAELRTLRFRLQQISDELTEKGRCAHPDGTECADIDDCLYHSLLSILNPERAPSI
jgi:hypothetical protein